MTYDFSNPNRPGPSSPLVWAAESLMLLIPEELRHSSTNTKIMLGLNMYGNDFIKSGGGGPVLGPQVRRLSLDCLWLACHCLTSNSLLL